jgi:hypothetical protein
MAAELNINSTSSSQGHDQQFPSHSTLAQVMSADDHPSEAKSITDETTTNQRQASEPSSVTDLNPDSTSTVSPGGSVGQSHRPVATSSAATSRGICNFDTVNEDGSEDV